MCTVTRRVAVKWRRYPGRRLEGWHDELNNFLHLEFAVDFPVPDDFPTPLGLDVNETGGEAIPLLVLNEDVICVSGDEVDVLFLDNLLAL